MIKIVSAIVPTYNIFNLHDSIIHDCENIDNTLIQSGAGLIMLNIFNVQIYNMKAN